MAKKIDLSELTFCIPVRIDSEYRLRNLLAVLRFYAAHIHANYILLEADSEQRIAVLPRIATLQYVYIHDENPIFHRTRYINRMLSMVRTRVAAVWDTDAVAPVPQLRKAYDNVLDGDSVMCYPYDGRFWGVSEFFSSAFCRTTDIRLLGSYSQPLYLMCSYYSVGGAFLVDVEGYRRCGWENEHFAGWGPEDAERYRRLLILGEQPSRIAGSLYHLYHTRGVNSGDYDRTLALSTKKEYVRICSMYPDELRKEIESWEWTRKEGI